jgi:hypothetical protein
VQVPGSGAVQATRIGSGSDFRIDDPDTFCLHFDRTRTKPMPKKPSPKPSAKSKPAKSQQSSQLAEFEVLPAPPKLSEFLTEDVIHNRHQNLVEMEQADLDSLAAAITICAEEADTNAEEALGSACLAVVSVWNCGGLLNIAKKQMRHGEFQKWFNDRIDVPGFSLRTAQRYMKLAGLNPRLTDLIASNPSIRQAYIACGILAEPPETEKTNKDFDATARLGLLRSIASVQTRLRRFSEKKIKLDKKTRKDLLATKAEIDQLFKALIG